MQGKAERVVEVMRDPNYHTSWTALRTAQRHPPGNAIGDENKHPFFSCSLQKKFIQVCRSPAVNQTWGQVGEE
jgi:hypothetical protein